MRISKVYSRVAVLRTCVSLYAIDIASNFSTRVSFTAIRKRFSPQRENMLRLFTFMCDESYHHNSIGPLSFCYVSRVISLFFILFFLIQFFLRLSILQGSIKINKLYMIVIFNPLIII